jgi:hypothetical protein
MTDASNVRATILETVHRQLSIHHRWTVHHHDDALARLEATIGLHATARRDNVPHPIGGERRTRDEILAPRRRSSSQSHEASAPRACSTPSCSSA